MDHRRFKMTDYYIIQEIDRFVTKPHLYEKVTQGLNETYKDFSDRCLKIIKKAEKQLGGNFIIADLTYLETTNQTHILES